MPAIPIRGDRSAWDALYYPQLHTNDINETTGIIGHLKEYAL